MSTELYEVLALASRYLFAFLGILIVLRAYFWLLTDHSERRQRLQKLPNAGMIGEFVVITGDRHLPAGSSVAIPWEGVLGSVRTADVFIPCDGVGRRHLYFSFDPQMGLLVQPCSGKDVLINGISLNCHSIPENTPLTHGSFLQAGSAMLRLRVFAGLDPEAGFSDDIAAPVMPASPSPESTFVSLQMPIFSPDHTSPLVVEQIVSSSENVFIDSSAPPPPLPDEMSFSAAIIDAPSHESSAESVEASSSPTRRRRRDRWEVDWSE